MTRAHLFLPTARGAPEAPANSPMALLARECIRLLGRSDGIHVQRSGVMVEGDAVDAMRLCLGSRLAQRVLWPLAHGPYGNEHDIHALAMGVRWTDWIDPDQTLRVDTTAQRSPLKSLNFAGLRVKDAVCDVLREATGARPSVDTSHPHLSLSLHLTADQATLYADISGEPLFKRGWRDARIAQQEARDRDPASTQSAEVHGEAPLKETLAAHMLAASGWDLRSPLLDPCCGAGTVVIEAAQMACGMAPGMLRSFAFERLKPWREHMATWRAMKAEAQAQVHAPTAAIHCSDISNRVLALAQANARRAGVAHAITFTQADATRREPPRLDAHATALTQAPTRAEEGPTDAPLAARPLIVTNPPFGLRIDARGGSGDDIRDFAEALSAQWKRHYAGWTAWVLSPDPDFESAMRLKAAARVPMWNGTIECRLLRLDLVAGTMRKA